MDGKIILKKINQSKEKENIKISFEILIDGQAYNLWYEISSSSCKLSYPLYESFDCIVVTFLLFAMKRGYDFYSEYPISEKLYYHLVYHVIPQINVCNFRKTKVISINAPITKKKFNGKFVATGISCGIDSLTTLYEYSEICDIDDYKLTHLVYFKTGAHDGQLGRFDEEKENLLFKNQLKNVKDFCKKYKYPLIVVDSNLNKVLSEAFGFTYYDRTHTLRSCGVMLLLQEYFSKFYYSSSYNLDYFLCDVDDGVAHYEKWLMPMLSNGNIEFYSSNKGMTRFEKTELLTKYHKSYDNLLVCWYEGENCGNCDKCIRTLVTLDIIGKLYLYENSFDIDKYLKNRKKYIYRVIALRNVDFLYDDVYVHMDKAFKREKSIIWFLLFKFVALEKHVKRMIKKVINKFNCI